MRKPRLYGEAMHWFPLGSPTEVPAGWHMSKEAFKMTPAQPPSDCNYTEHYEKLLSWAQSFPQTQKDNNNKWLWLFYATKHGWFVTQQLITRYKGIELRAISLWPPWENEAKLFVLLLDPPLLPLRSRISEHNLIPHDHWHVNLPVWLWVLKSQALWPLLTLMLQANPHFCFLFSKMCNNPDLPIVQGGYGAPSWKYEFKGLLLFFHFRIQAGNWKTGKL